MDTLFRPATVAGMNVSVLTSASDLYTLINAASNNTTANYPVEPTALDIKPEDGDIRVTFDPSFTPTSTAGRLVKKGELFQVRNRPVKNMKFISAGTSAVKCSIEVGTAKMGESDIFFLGGTSDTATQNAEGLMPASLYQAVAFVPPTDPTDAIPTTGATGVYTEVDVTNVTSSIDSSITNIGYKRCHDNGHAATQKLIPVLLFPGFTSSGRTEFSDAMVRRMAGYVDPASGRAPLVIKTQTRGRGNGGTIDRARDAQDALDILDHASSAVGANVYGTAGQVSAICIGYSTGALDALNFAARFPDRCLGVVCYYPNYDLGVDPYDSYYPLQTSTNRAIIAGQVQPSGDVRLTTGAASIDQYLARNAIDAVPRIMSIPGGPHVWVIGDTNDPEPLPTRERLRDALQAIPAAKAKAHIHITATGDSNRVLHGDGDDSAAAQYAERYYFPFLLANAAEWTMPRTSPAGGLRLLGWMKTKLFEIWLGRNSSPKTDGTYGGRDHAAEFEYDDYIRKFTVRPVASLSGYCQTIRDGDNRNTAITAGTKTTIDLNVSRTITTVTDVGYEHSFRADLGVTNSSGVTNWADQIGALAFTAAANKPSYTTDANAKNIIRFNSASSQKLVLNSLLVNPLQDFTISFVAAKTSSGDNYGMELSHHGSSAIIPVRLSSTPTAIASFTPDGGGTGIANVNGVGNGQPFTLNAPHVFTLMRKNGYLYMSVDGQLWGKSAFTSSAFTLTGTVETTVGCGWANGGGVYWNFFDGDFYEIDSKQSAISDADLFSYIALMKSRWSF